MAMIVQNNPAAALALGELNKNIKKAGDLLSKVATGQKIVGAKDDSAQFAISEKMREQIRSLFQDDQNVQNGSSLFKIAAGGIDNIVEELRNLKELAINAANDTNNDGDRLTIQKEFTQRMANINDIATETEYNTKKLLDGTAGISIKTESYLFWAYGGNAINMDESSLFEPTSPISIITSGDYTINSDGVYVLDNDYSGTVNINTHNVKITQKDPTINLNQVHITFDSQIDYVNLWMENVNIHNGTERIVMEIPDGKHVVLTTQPLMLLMRRLNTH